MKKDYLLVLDVPHIKDFLFSTDKLSEIKGASRILDTLNRDITPLIFENLFKNKCEKIYCNGGSGQFLIKDSTQDDIINVTNVLKKVYRIITNDTAHIIFGYAEYKDNFKEALKEAYKKINFEKNTYNSRKISIHTPFIKECESCGYNEAQVKDKVRNDIICYTCYIKREPYSEKLWKRLKKIEEIEEIYLKIDEIREETKKKFDDEIKDFEKIDEAHIGLIYGDGNNMGIVVKELNSIKISKFFSEMIDKSIREACYNALETYCVIQENNKIKIKASVLILGGDDVLIVVPKLKAIEVAMKISEVFKEKTKEKINSALSQDPEIEEFFNKEELKLFKERGFTVSLGIAIGKPKQSFKVLLNQAQELLKNAKLKGFEKRESDFYTESYIDFQDTTLSSFSDIYKIRENYKNIGRPYSIEDLNKIFKYAKDIKEKNIPKTRLEYIKQALFKPEYKLTNEILFNFTRLTKEQRKIFIDALEKIGGPLGFLENIYLKKDKKREENILLDLVELSLLLY